MKFIKQLTIVTILFVLAGITVVDAKELRLGSVAPDKSPWGQFYHKFADKLGELSGGTLTVAVYNNAELGDEQTMIRQVARGRLDMLPATNTAVSLLLPEFSLLASPFVFDSIEEADYVADEHIIKTFTDSLTAVGVVPVATVEVGYQIILSKSLIKTPSDLANVKIRTAPTKTDTYFIQEAGGVAVPLGTVDSMPALKTGGIDAATFPTLFGIVAGYSAEAPNLTLTNHVHQIGLLVMSTKLWKTLSEKEKGYVMEAGKELRGLRKVLRGVVANLLKKAESTPGTTVYTPTAEEMAAWRAVAPKTQERVLEDLGANGGKIWAKINEAKAAYKADK